MRPCTNCRSTNTTALSTGVLPRIAAILGSSPALVAYVCRVCRHVDVWLDEAALLPEEDPQQAAELVPAR